MVPSMKRGDFMDKWPALEDLSMKRGVLWMNMADSVSGEAPSDMIQLQLIRKAKR